MKVGIAGSGFDQRAIMTVCVRAAGVAGVGNVTVSLPRLVGGQGVLETFPLPLNKQETVSLRDSAGVIRNALHELADG
jgi:L-lactate dehydrogenase